MDIIFYAGSLRPGGGLTVAKIMIEAMAENPANNIVVYTGAKDSSQLLRTTFESHKNIKEVKFLHNVNAEIRYVISKFYFLPKSLFNRKTLLISVNFYIPTFYKLFVYHLNLSNFIRQSTDSFSKIIKEFDAALACRFATINVFESDYLKDAAAQYTNIKIHNPKRLYIGIDPEFYKVRSCNTFLADSTVLLVSSPQPHKDNQTCIDTLRILIEKQPSSDWLLTIVGGQSIEQWVELKTYATHCGVEARVIFLGPVEKNRLSDLMQQSLCLVSSSKIESFCMVAVEAMASGCPAIVTNETSMPESVSDAAIIVEAGSANQFSQAIIDLSQNQKARNVLINKGRVWANKFTYSSFKEELLTIIKS